MKEGNTIPYINIINKCVYQQLLDLLLQMIADYLTIHFMWIIEETLRFFFQFSHRFNFENVYAEANKQYTHSAE